MDLDKLNKIKTKIVICPKCEGDKEIKDYYLGERKKCDYCNGSGMLKRTVTVKYKRCK